MFKHQNLFNAKEETTQHQDLSQKKDLHIQNIPIHTMNKDIQEIEHPTTKMPLAEESNTFHAINGASLNEKQKSSPFLNTAIATPTQQTGGQAKSASANTSKIANNIISKQKPTPPQASHLKYKLFIAISLIFAMLVAIGIGVYYSKTIQPSKTTSIAPPPTEEPKEMTTSTPEPKFSTTTANYLPLDITTIDSAQAKEHLRDLAVEIHNSSTTIPIEFILTDLQDNLITFAMFSQKIGLDLSADILAALGDKFSLFVFNDLAGTRIGLAIDILDAITLKNALLESEATLATELEAILLATDFEFPTAMFGVGEYAGLSIRYQNIVSPEDLSIDYTMTDKQLLIGTTKMTLRSIIDKIILTTIPQASEITNDTAQPVDNLIDTE